MSKGKKNYTEPAIGEPAESQKIFCMIDRYIIDKNGIDIGCGGWKVIGSMGIDIRKGVADIVGDITEGLEALFKKAKKGRFLNGGLDYIFSSHLLEDFTGKEQMKLLRDWLQYLKPGGHLILYVPQKGAYKGTNLAHKREFCEGDLEKMFYELKLKIKERFYESEAKSGYSILMVGEKVK